MVTLYYNMGIKSPLVWLVPQYLYLFGVSFHCSESVGKYRIIFRNLPIFLLYQSGENIRHCAICHNPLILSLGAHGDCHGPHY